MDCGRCVFRLGDWTSEQQLQSVFSSEVTKTAVQHQLLHWKTQRQNLSCDALAFSTFKIYRLHDTGNNTHSFFIICPYENIIIKTAFYFTIVCMFFGQSRIKPTPWKLRGRWGKSYYPYKMQNSKDFSPLRFISPTLGVYWEGAKYSSRWITLR